MSIIVTMLVLLLLAPMAQAITWGTATAAYQVEGYRHAGGRNPSIWDAFDTRGISDVMKAVKPNGQCNVDGCQNASVCGEDYMRYPESAELSSTFGFGAMRLSVSWPRIMSYSLEANELKSSPNLEGIEYYRKMFKVYHAKGIALAVTMFHWDLPLAIEEFAVMRGCKSAWLNCDWFPHVFAEYVNLLMKEFRGDVSYWITLNEPKTVANSGYSDGDHAPGRCSDPNRCWGGNSSTEPYIAAKMLILAHARAFRIWQAWGQPGLACGIVLNADMHLPFTDSPDDRKAADRATEWQSALFFDPIHYGRWPQSMVELVGDRLPPWTEAEIDLVQGSHDGHFFMNHYTTKWTRAKDGKGGSFSTDSLSESSGFNFTSGVPIGTPSSNGWLYNYGPGLGKLIAWHNTRYPGLKYIVTENGWGNASQPNAEADIFDFERCNFYRDYLGNMSKTAFEQNIDVHAYFAWSLMDNYEWADGFVTRFGLTYVDYHTQERIPKLSMHWFRTYVTPLRKLPTDGKPFPACESVVPQLLMRKLLVV